MVTNNTIDGLNPTNDNIFVGTTTSNRRACVYLDYQIDNLLPNQLSRSYSRSYTVQVKLIYNSGESFCELLKPSSLF